MSRPHGAAGTRLDQKIGILKKMPDKEGNNLKAQAICKKWRRILRHLMRLNVLSAEYQQRIRTRVGQVGHFFWRF